MKYIFGSVVGRKFQKISHKIAKSRCTKKEEHIVIENMHESIIDTEIWNKAQEKLNNYTKVRERKYEHVLKGLVHCGECGNKATLRCREEKRKNGSVWRGTYFICSKRNNYSGLCDCKQISASLIEEVVKKQVKNELKKINLSEEEIKQSYEYAREQAKSKENLLKENLKNLKEQLKEVEKNIEEIYQDKISKIIQVEDFKIIYEKKQKQRDKILKEIKIIQESLNQNDEQGIKANYREIKKIADDFLKLENTNKVILEQLIEKIEFDKEKNIKIKLTFENPIVDYK